MTSLEVATEDHSRRPKQTVFCMCGGISFLIWGRDFLVGLVVTVVSITSIFQVAEK